MRRLLYTTALVSVITVASPVVWAGPQNGVVTGGAASISQTGNLTTINQSSSRAIIRWDKFNVAQPEHVEFVHTNSSSITVNRIMDNDPSKIDGSIHANGRIVLINPNGIVFGASSKVDVGGLVATTSDLDDDNAFMAGGVVKFTKPGDPNAAIINRGEITVQQAGLVGLIAPNVQNHGVIVAKLGRVQLASGDIHTIDFAGDGLIKLEVSDAVTSQSVTNTGLIHADGGQVLITAAQARNAVDALITNSGSIRANTVNGQKGSIKISTKGLDNTAPRGKGTILNDGIIEVSGDDVNEKGGQITILADLIALTGNAQLNASGDTDGGIILVGGNQQGGGGLPTSQMLYVGQDVILNVSSRRNGNAGRVILWSDENTRFYGDIFARGGDVGGNGGFVEVSSKGVLDYNGVTNLLAPHGTSGTLLLDPTDILISTGGNVNVSGSSPFAPNLDDGPSVLNVTTLTTALGLGSVIVQTRATGSQAGDITVDTAITWAAANTLTLEAHHNIIVNAAISGPSLTLTAGNDVQLNAGISGSGTLTIQTLNAGGSIGIGTGQAGALNLTDAELALIANGYTNIIIGRTDMSGTLNVGANTWNDNLTLQTGLGNLNVNGVQTMGTNNFNATTVGGPISIGGAVNTTAGAIALNSAGGNITTAAALSTTTTGTVTINSGSGSISTGGAISTGSGTIALTAAGAGTIVIGTGGITSTTGALNLTSATGIITVNDVTNVGNTTITTDGNLALGVANALGGTGTLTITQASIGTTIGLGDSQTGTVNLTNAEVARIKDGWTSITIGRSDGTGIINVGALTWSDALTLRTNTGAINLNGVQTIGGNTLSVNTTGGAIAIAGVSGGAGNISFTSGGATITSTGAISTTTGSQTYTSGGGIITTGTGALSSTTGAITMTSGAANIVIGAGGIASSTSGNIGLTTTGGAISVAGALSTAGAGTIILTSAGGNISTTGAVTSATGAITYASDAGNITTTGAITSTTGTKSFTATGAGTITIGTGGMTSATGAIINITSATGIIAVNGTVNSGTAAMTITTDANLALNAGAALNGTGVFTLRQASNTIGIALGDSQTGTLNLTTAEYSRIGTNWTSQNYGSSGGTAAINIGTLTFGDVVTIFSDTGAVNFNGALGVGGNNLTVTASGASNISVNSTLTQSGGATLTLTTAGGSIATSTGLISRSASTGLLNFTSGGGNITIGSGGITNSTGSMTFTSGGGSIITGGTISSSTGAKTFNSGAGAMTIGAGGITATGASALGLSSTSGLMTINNAISNGTGAITINTNSNLAINAAITSTGALTIAGATSGTSMGIGTGQTGDLQLSDAEIAFLGTTFSARIFGYSGMTGAINIGAYTTALNTTFNTSSGVITVAGDINMGAATLSITTAADLVVNADINGTGSLNINAQGNATMGIGDGQVGVINLTNDELAHISTLWTNITIGSTTNSGAMNVGANSWNSNLTFNTGAGVMTVGAQTMAATKNLTLLTNSNLALNGAISGTGILTIAGAAVTTSVGLAGGAGTLSLTSGELDQIGSGWTALVLGHALSTAIMNVGAYDWENAVTFRGTSAAINFTGNQTATSGMTVANTSGAVSFGANSASLTGGNLAITTTTGAITLGNVTISAGNLALTNGAAIITLGGTTNVGSGNATITTDGNLALTGALTGTGILTISAAVGTAIGIGDSQTGTLNLTNAELDRITDGWNGIVIGNAASTAAGVMNVGGYTWRDNLTLQTGAGVMTIGGVTNMGANNLVISANSNVAINDSLTGTGTLTIQGSAAATIMGIGSNQLIGATLALDDVELGRLLSGWSEIIFGSLSGTGLVNVGARTWQYDMRFRSSTGAITFAGVQNFGSKNLTVESDGNVAISAALNGTGILTFKNAAAARQINLNTGTVNLALNATDLGNISDGWSNIILQSTGAISIALTRAWLDNLTLRTPGTITISNVQNMGTNTLTLESDGDITLGITNALTGTGTLRIRGLADATVIGVGAGQTGTLNLNATDLARIATGWSSVEIGRTGATGNVNIGANAFANSMSFLTNGSINLNGNISSSVAGTGTNLVFYTGTSFVNGATYTISPGSGRYLLYSVSAGANTMGGLTATNTVNAQTYFGYGPASVVETDNVFLYSFGAAKIVYLRADDKVKIYGDSVPTFTYSYIGGLQGADTLSGAVLSASLSAVGALTTDSVGVTRAITGTFSTALGYTVQLTDGTLSVSKAPVSVQANTASRAYGDADQPFTVVYTGLKNGEDSSVIDLLATASTAATGSTSVGVYLDGVNSIAVASAADNNYTFNYSNNTLTITQAALTITADNQTKTYGAVNPVLSATFTGLKNGELSSIVTGLSLVTTAVTGSNVGNYTITASGGVSSNYAITYVDGTLSVTTATLTITADSTSRQYGLANPGFSASYTGFVNGDDSNDLTGLILSSDATLTSDVGNYAITASGATNANYNIGYVAGNLEVTKATLTATADNKTKIYGDANPGLTVTYTGFRNSDDQSVIDTGVNVTTAATISSGVNNYAINTSAGLDNNYDFTYVAGNLSVTPAALTITADNKTKIYGDANPTLTASYSPFKNGDTSAVVSGLNLVTTAVTGSNVNNYAITASGATAANYTITYVGGTLSVTPAALTITADNKTKIYGDANPTLTASYAGLKNSDTSSVVSGLSLVTTAVLGSNVNNYSITASAGTAANYTISYVGGTLSVTPAALTITADNKTKIYGDANPTLTASYSAFKNGDDSSDISGLILNTAATTASGVNNYAITASGATNANYTIAFVDGNLSVTPAALTITADNKTKIYGDANPGLTASYSPFKNGDTSAVVTGLNLVTTAVTGSNVNNYSITASGATASNYTISYVGGTLSVTPAVLTITADNKTKIYGDANPTLTASYSAFKNGDDSSDISGLILNTAATTASGVNNYAITASGATNANYTISFVAGNLSVTPAALTITADNKTKIYGDANPTLTASYAGLKNSDTSSVVSGLSLVTTAVLGSNVNNYSITASAGTAANYTISYVGGTLSVTPAALTITADNKTKIYGDANPTLSASYSPFKNGDTSAVVSGLNLATTAVTGSNVNNYSITASGATASNYTISYAGGTLSVTPAALTITADNKTKIYGDANPTLTASYSAFKNGDTSADITGLILNTAAVTGSNVNNYTITAAGATNSNYTITFVNGTLSITKAMLTATADNKTRVYGNNNPALTVTYTGFKNSDGVGVIGTQATAITAATIASDVNNYAITASGASDNNYDFTYVAGNLSITKSVLTATVQNGTRVYGDANPGFTIVYTGFKNAQNSGVIDTLATATTTAGLASNVGNYAITGSGGVDSNYSFNYVAGNLNVTKATLSVTANDAARYYSDPSPVLTASYSGFKNGDNTGDIDTLATLFSVGETPATSIGFYTISASAASDNNYNFAYTSGLYEVIDDGLAPQPIPTTPTTSIPSTVESIMNQSSNGNIGSHFYTVHDVSRSDSIQLSDIIVLPQSSMYDVDLNEISFILAITDQLRDIYDVNHERDDE